MPLPVVRLPPWLRCCNALAAVLWWSVLALALLLALAWGVLQWVIVPKIGDFGPQLEQRMSKALGVELRLGHISAESNGFFATVVLKDVTLFDAQKRPALRLPQVRAQLSPRSMLELNFDQLVIESPDLDIRRLATGNISVAGIDLGGAKADAGDASPALDWFFAQNELAIVGARLSFTDELRGASAVTLSQVNLIARNPGSSRDFLLDATPPPDWGKAMHLRGKFRAPLFGGRKGDWQRWQGVAYAAFEQTNVAELKRVFDLNLPLQQGTGAVRLWADMEQGRITQATADVALTNAQVQLGPELPALKLARFQGRLSLGNKADAMDIALQQLQFATADGLVFPAADIALAWTGAGSRPAAQATANTETFAFASSLPSLPDGTKTRGKFSVDGLDLAVLARLASHLPLGTQSHALLADLAPRGTINGLQGQWQGPWFAPANYGVQGKLGGLGLNPGKTLASRSSVADGVTHTLPGRPGVENLSMAFEATQAGGKASIAVANGSLSLPGVFELAQVELAQLSTQAVWKLEQKVGAAPKIEVSLDKLRVVNAHFAAEAKARWHTADGDKPGGSTRFPGVIDLTGVFSRFDAGQTHRYLPMGIAKPARDYVRDSLQSGLATDLKFTVKGDLYNMPFDREKDGIFALSGPVKGVKYAFVPKAYTPSGATGWPAFTQLSGVLAFNQTSMQLSNATARLEGQPGLVVRADARIPSLVSGLNVALTGGIAGPLPELLAVVGSTPLNELTQQTLAKAQGTGNADLRLRLNLPVFSLADSKVQGSVTFAGNEITINPESPKLSNVRGVVNFSESGFSIAPTRAIVLGGEARIEGGMQRVNLAGQPTAASVSATGNTDQAVLVRAVGVASADGLRREASLGYLSRLAGNASGQANYNANIRIRKGVVEALVTSDLRGLALRLPAPLNKAADASLPIRFENQLQAKALADDKLHELMRLDIGSVASVSFERDLGKVGADASAAFEPVVLRGSILAGVPFKTDMPPDLPENGVVANVALPVVDVDAWEQALLAPNLAQDKSLAPKRESVAGLSYLPTVVAIAVQELKVGGRTLHHVVAGGRREGSLWLLNLDATELNGYLEYRQPVGNGAGRLYARLAKLTVAAADASEVESLLDKQPAGIPALDVVVEEFELKGRKLGRLEVEAVNRGAGAVVREGGVREGGVREWRLNRLAVLLPEASFSAQGNWAALGAGTAGTATSASAAPTPPPTRGLDRRRTVMNIKLDVHDSGELLKRFGMGGTIRGGKGNITGQLAWVGSPLGFDYPSLTGQLNLNMESGQFLKAEPGLAKLLGVLSLQALPRRLSLDFRDVFSEGFSFDFIRADAGIDAGIASTNNFQMKGVNAAVLIEGKADIAKETQDLLVRVVPEINAGTASLIATAINPAIGLGTFLAQLVLRRPLIMATTQSFEIKGSWLDPKVNKVDSTAALAAESKPAAGESSLR